MRTDQLAYQEQDYLDPYLVLADTPEDVKAWANQQGIDPNRCLWALEPVWPPGFEKFQVTILKSWSNVTGETRTDLESTLDLLQPRWR